MRAGMTAPSRGSCRPLVLVPLAFAGIALSACGAAPTVSRSELEREVSDALGAAVHRAPPNISCPSGLPAKVGATEHCVLSVAGESKRLGVRVRITAVKASHVHITEQVATTPLPAGSG